MSRSQLQASEIALLGKLNHHPLELGELPFESVARLARLGLVRKVLGYCEITRAGQLTYQRDHFRKQSLGRVARIAQRNPLSLFRRRTIDTHAGNTPKTSRWMARYSSETSSNVDNGLARPVGQEDNK